MSAILRQSVRPGLNAVLPVMRYGATTRIGARRTLATLYEQKVPPSSGPSTALKPGVRLAEEKDNVQIVGEEVKGSEGPHYQGELGCSGLRVWD